MVLPGKLIGSSRVDDRPAMTADTRPRRERELREFAADLGVYVHGDDSLVRAAHRVVMSVIPHGYEGHPDYSQDARELADELVIIVLCDADRKANHLYYWRDESLAGRAEWTPSIGLRAAWWWGLSTDERGLVPSGLLRDGLSAARGERFGPALIADPKAVLASATDRAFPGNTGQRLRVEIMDGLLDGLDDRDAFRLRAACADDEGAARRWADEQAGWGGRGELGVPVATPMSRAGAVWADWNLAMMAGALRDREIARRCPLDGPDCLEWARQLVSRSSFHTTLGRQQHDQALRAQEAQLRQLRSFVEGRRIAKPREQRF